MTADLLKWMTGMAVCVYLIPCAVSDVRTNRISFRYLAACLTVSAAAAGILTATGIQTPSDLLLSLMPGLFLLVVTVVTSGKIGTGDGLIFLTIGLLIGCRAASLVMLIALVLSAIWGSSLLLRKKAGRNSRIAWVPFILVGQMLWMATELTGA